MILEKIAFFCQSQIHGTIKLFREVDVVAVADSQQVFICRPIGFDNLIVAVRIEFFGKLFGENLIAVSPEGMPGSEVIFLEFIAINNGNSH